MEDPVVCADGHSYERAAITQWLLARDTSPCTNAPLLHKNVVPNHALRNLIAEVRGVRRPITLEEHVAAATPCCPEELDDSQDSTATATAPTQGEGEAPELAPVLALGAPRRDDETAAAPAHAAEAKQPIEPCAALCVQSAIGGKTLRPRPVGKNALHWAMVEGLQSEQKQLRLLLNPQLAAQPDQGGNLPLHYAASSGVSTACAVACALAFMDGLEWANKTGRTPLEIARLEGHVGLADVLSGMLNRRHNELHACFTAGAEQEAEQIRLLTCRQSSPRKRTTMGTCRCTLPPRPVPRSPQSTSACASSPTPPRSETAMASCRINWRSSTGSSPWPRRLPRVPARPCRASCRVPFWAAAHPQPSPSRAPTKPWRGRPPAPSSALPPPPNPPPR